MQAPDDIHHGRAQGVLAERHEPWKPRGLIALSGSWANPETQLASRGGLDPSTRDAEHRRDDSLTGW